LLLLTGLSIDGAILLGKRARWSLSTFNWEIAFAAAVSTTIGAALTFVVLGSALARGQATPGGQVGIAFLLSLALAVLGGLLGSWLGTKVSTTVQDLRR
jgi:hypothetical protein